MKSKSKLNLLIAILIPLAVGMLSALLTKDSAAVYASLNKPALSPPGVVFPIVWTILYILMGISSYLIYTSDSPDAPAALRCYAVQLALNFGWSLLFFNLAAYLPAFFWLLLLIAVLLIQLYRFYRISPLAAYLQIPYLLWCLFAAYLNLSIYLLNT